MNKNKDPFDGCEMLTVERAKKLERGEILLHISWTNMDGTPERWRVNGKPKTWKTRPNDIQVPIKNGLHRYSYAYLYYKAFNFDDGYKNLDSFCVRKETK
jgi:hypothetical protein